MEEEIRLSKSFGNAKNAVASRREFPIGKDLRDASLDKMML